MVYRWFPEDIRHNSLHPVFYQAQHINTCNLFKIGLRRSTTWSGTAGKDGVLHAGLRMANLRCRQSNIAVWWTPHHAAGQIRASLCGRKLSVSQVQPTAQAPAQCTGGCRCHPLRRFDSQQSCRKLHWCTIQDVLHSNSNNRQSWQWVIFYDPWSAWPIDPWPAWPVTHDPRLLSSQCHSVTWRFQRRRQVLKCLVDNRPSL